MRRAARIDHTASALTHAAQQQADAATILTTLGHSPGDIGYPEMLKRDER